MNANMKDSMVNKIPSVLKQLAIAIFLEDLKEPFSEIHFTGKFPILKCLLGAGAKT